MSKRECETVIMRLNMYRGDPMAHDLDPAHAADLYGTASKVPGKLWEAIVQACRPHPAHTSPFCRKESEIVFIRLNMYRGDPMAHDLDPHTLQTYMGQRLRSQGSSGKQSFRPEGRIQLICTKKAK